MWLVFRIEVESDKRKKMELHRIVAHTQSITELQFIIFAKRLMFRAVKRNKFMTPYRHNDTTRTSFHSQHPPPSLSSSPYISVSSVFLFALNITNAIDVYIRWWKNW